LGIICTQPTPIIEIFLARAFFDVIISGIFHSRSRRDFKQKIAVFIVSEFYDQ
jgi:hypothetical protein